MKTLSLQIKKFHIVEKPLTAICTKTVGLTVFIYMKRARLLVKAFPTTPQPCLYDVWFGLWNASPTDEHFSNIAIFHIFPYKAYLVFTR